MKKFSVSLFVLLVLSMVLSACQAATPVEGGTEEAAAAAPAVMATLLPTATPRPQPTATSAAQPAQTALLAYCAALQAGQPADAAALLSDFGLLTADLSRREAQSQLAAQMQAGKGWQECQLRSIRLLDDQTALAEVSFRLADASKSEQAIWALRFEADRWGVNWGGAVDRRTLYVEPQKLNDVTVQPLELVRYTDRLQLRVMVQNNRDEGLVWGAANQPMASFHWGDKTLDAAGKRLVFNTQKSYSSAAVDLPGFYETDVQSVDLRFWHSLDFHLVWRYHFDL